MFEVASDAERGVCRFLDGARPLDRRGCDCARRWVYPCEVFGAASPGDPAAPGAGGCCDSCTHHQPDDGAPDDPPERLVLENDLCPGDVVVMTAAVECLHRAHPNRYVTAVESTAPGLWDHNPRVSSLSGDALAGARRLRMRYPLIDQSDARPVHFMQGYCDFLADALAIPVPLVVNRPFVYLSDEERDWLPQVHEATGRPTRYWVVNAGHKADYTAKWWGAWNYQEVVDRLRGRVLFVQIGEAHHSHPPLSGVLDLRGKTDVRQLVRLVHHAAGGLGPSTFLQHLCAALDRPYVLLAGGREPVAWQHYPRQTTLSTIGRLGCCADRACWRSRVRPLGDGADADRSLCERPRPGRAPGEWAPECLERTRPAVVAEAVEDADRAALEGGRQPL